uniref:Uncharacterized protein n=1 Tax=Ditylenchus dipsaci TaxID=166011 RepID=A0A915CX42_9BILA
MKRAEKHAKIIFSQLIFQINIYLIYIAQFLWYSAHGLSPVIYLTMNETIKKDSKIFFYRAFGKYFAYFHKGSSVEPSSYKTSGSRTVLEAIGSHQKACGIR